MRRILLFLLLAPLSIFAQIGGASTFEFVTLPYSASENAFGGNIITQLDNKVAFALKNPSLLDSSFSNEATGNYGLLHQKDSGIGYGSIGFAHTLSHNITMVGGIHFISYGTFDGYDESGTETGHFFPKEYLLICGASYPIKEHLTVGANIKPLLSYLESYSSYAMLFDAGITYKKERTCASLTIRNAGWQLKPYTDGNREPIPYSIDLGISQKLEHAPLQFNLAYENLQKFDISNVELKKKKTTSSLYVDDEERAFVTFGKKFLKHIDISTEIFIGKNIVAMLGYNYQKSDELSFGTTKKGVGLNVGLALNFSRFQISYGWAKQHVAGGRNAFTLAFNAETIYSVCRNKKNAYDNRN